MLIKRCFFNFRHQIIYIWFNYTLFVPILPNITKERITFRRKCCRKDKTATEVACFILRSELNLYSQWVFWMEFLAALWSYLFKSSSKLVKIKIREAKKIKNACEIARARFWDKNYVYAGSEVCEVAFTLMYVHKYHKFGIEIIYNFL